MHFIFDEMKSQYFDESILHLQFSYEIRCVELQGIHTFPWRDPLRTLKTKNLPKDVRREEFCCQILSGLWWVIGRFKDGK